MGLLRAAAAATRGVLADQWLEFFYCEALPENVLAVKGRKRINRGGQNVAGTDNIISDGSVIAVADGQCIIIVEQGQILDVCAEPGEYLFDLGTEPSVFGGETFIDGALDSLMNVWERVKFGGQPGKDTRVYYFNTKEILGNKYGTANPVPFRVVDRNIGLDVDISIRFFGHYTYRITNPVLFYANISGNFAHTFVREQLDAQLKAEIMDALQPAVAKISAMGVRYSALPGHTTEFANALNDVLSPKWQGSRGLELQSFSVASVSASTEDEQMIKDLQRTAVMRDPSMAAAMLVGAQAEALQAAAANEAGAITGFLGLGMAQTSGGTNADRLFALAKQQSPVPNAPTAEPSSDPSAWTCACAAVNNGRFCHECGSPNSSHRPQYKCDKCGWMPPDPSKPTRFCPECGDPFDNDDLV
jgi:membrane protease subunit (stomatin/prohibitin family)